jgi:uncharacterized MnhB-related membrane protein
LALGLAGMAVIQKDLIYAVLCLSGSSMLIAFVFYLLGAPDLAITEGIVGLISLGLFVFTISRVGRTE